MRRKTNDLTKRTEDIDSKYTRETSGETMTQVEGITSEVHRREGRKTPHGAQGFQNKTQETRGTGSETRTLTKINKGSQEKKETQEV